MVRLRPCLVLIILCPIIGTIFLNFYDFSGPPSSFEFKLDLYAGKMPLSRRRHVLVIDETLPSYPQHISGKRLMYIFHGLREIGHRVTFLARYHDGGQLIRDTLGWLGVDIAFTNSFGTDALEHLFANEKIDVVIMVMRAWNRCPVPSEYIPKVRALSNTTKIITLSDDLFYEREAAMVNFGLGLESVSVDELKTWETNIYKSSDAVIVPTTLDQRRYPEGATTLPWPMPLKTIVPIHENRPPFDARHGLIFEGDGHVLEDQLTVQYILKEILPVLREKNSTMSFTIIGRPPSREHGLKTADSWLEGSAYEDDPFVKEYHKPSLDDIKRLYFRAKIFLNPVVAPSGVRVTTINSMAYGAGIVSSQAGIRGMEVMIAQPPLSLNQIGHVVMEDDRAKLIEAVHAVMAQQPLWLKLSMGAAESANAGHAKSPVHAAQIKLSYLWDRPASPRPQLDNPCVIERLSRDIV